LKNTKDFRATFFHGKKLCVLILTKDGMGHTLGAFLTNSSGHLDSNLSYAKYQRSPRTQIHHCFEGLHIQQFFLFPGLPLDTKIVLCTSRVCRIIQIGLLLNACLMFMFLHKRTFFVLQCLYILPAYYVLKAVG
jgi:hypothetical protein